MGNLVAAPPAPARWRGRWSFYRAHILAMAARWLEVDRAFSAEPQEPMDEIAQRMVNVVHALDTIEQARVADGALREQAREATAALHAARVRLSERLRQWLALGSERLPDVPREPNGRLPRTGRRAIELAVALTESAMVAGLDGHPDVLELQRCTREAMALDLDAALDRTPSSRRGQRDDLWRVLSHDVRLFVPHARLALRNHPERATHYRVRRPEHVGDTVRNRRGKGGAPPNGSAP